jgi:hypothetical protein
MKIKLTQEGWAGYNGQMGVLQFVDGLSTTEVPFRDAARMSAVMSCEFEDGSSCNPAQRLLDTMGQEAVVGRETEVETAAPPASTVVPSLTEQPAIIQKAEYTVAQLEEIADAKGIVGLRDIATPLGIKSNSITGLIAELTKAGMVAKPVASVVEVVEVEGE